MTDGTKAVFLPLLEIAGRYVPPGVSAALLVGAIEMATSREAMTKMFGEIYFECTLRHRAP